MLAALTAHPDLGCTGGPYELWTIWGVADDVLCAGNEKVYTLLDDVLTEVAETFPSEYIHIGGDECPKDRWKACDKCQAKIKELLHTQRLQLLPPARITPAASASLMPGGKLARLLSKLLLETAGEI